MKPLYLLLSLAAFALGGTAWFALHRAAPEESEPAAIEPDAVAGGAAGKGAGELADPDAPVNANDESSDSASDARIALGHPPEPPAKDDVKRDMPTGPFTGRVVDERTSLPLPRFMVRLQDVAGRRIDAVTDDEGNFTASEPLAIGAVRMAPIDHPQRRRPFARIVYEHAALDARPPVISVASGPTYHVSFGPATSPDASTIELRLRARNDDGSDRTDLDPVRATEPYRKEGEELWVRFPALDPAYAKAEAIEARSRDGIWIGEAPATIVKGVATGVVHIELEARAVIAGVVMQSGTPVPEALVTLRAIPKGEGDKGWERSMRTGNDGRYRFDFLRPCDARMNVRSILNAPNDSTVTLRSNETTTHDVALTPYPTVGRIQGKVVTDTGTYEPDARFTLVRDNENGREVARLRTKVIWSTHDGVREGRFDFGLLPKGKFRISVEEDDWFEWSPRRIVTEAPKEDIVVHVADAVLVADIAFDVHDADNGLPLTGFHLQLETFDGDRSEWSDSGRTVLERYPEDKRLTWRLDKDGYPSQIGDLSSFAVRTLVGGRPRRTCEINVQPGWSDYLRITRRNDNKPLEGVVVLADGKEVGKSNADGVARIALRDKPSAITVTLDGWRMAGRVDLQSPSKRNYRRFNPVQMQAAKKK